jgi:hypothetical protein
MAFFVLAERTTSKDSKIQGTMEPEELTFQLLREITDGFSKERKVGEGAFGAVYRVRFRCALL